MEIFEPLLRSLLLTVLLALLPSLVSAQTNEAVRVRGNRRAREAGCRVIAP
jgi:hypothetical protein